MFNIAIYNNVKDVKPTLVPIDDFKNLPSGAEDKSNSKLWSPVPLTVRKKVVNQKVNISALIGTSFGILPQKLINKILIISFFSTRQCYKD